LIIYQKRSVKLCRGVKSWTFGTACQRRAALFMPPSPEPTIPGQPAKRARIDYLQGYEWADLLTLTERPDPVEEVGHLDGDGETSPWKMHPIFHVSLLEPTKRQANCDNGIELLIPCSRCMKRGLTLTCTMSSSSKRCSVCVRSARTCRWELPTGSEWDELENLEKENEKHSIRCFQEGRCAMTHDSELLAERDEILKTRQVLLLLPNSRLWISFPSPVCAEDEVRTEREAIGMKRPGNAVRPCRTCAELASRTVGFITHLAYSG
jgi:hypothetical protein